MKHKTSKRSTKRSSQTQTHRSSISTDHTQTISSNKVDLSSGTVDLDLHRICLKPNVPLKSQKLLKRDLLRCSNQRPSLLGSQTLQPPRISHHGPQQSHSVISSSSLIDHRNIQNRRSLSVNSHTIYPTIDRIAPWPDISINRLFSDENHLSRPLKTHRHMKNPNLFLLNDNSTKFKFHPSKRTYIDEYRKQKGYLLSSKSTKNTSVSLSSSTQFLNFEDDQLSTIGTYSGGGGAGENYTARERSDLSTTELSVTARGISKSLNDINTNPSSIILSTTNHYNVLPSISNRNNNIRSTRHTQLHHQTITLPTMPNTSIQYLNTVEKNKKTHLRDEHQSKLVFIDGRQKKRNSPTIVSRSEITTYSQGNSGFPTTCSPVVSKIRPIIVYRIRHRTESPTTQNNIGSLS